MDEENCCLGFNSHHGEVTGASFRKASNELPAGSSRQHGNITQVQPQYQPPHPVNRTMHPQPLIQSFSQQQLSTVKAQPETSAHSPSPIHPPINNPTRYVSTTEQYSLPSFEPPPGLPPPAASTILPPLTHDNIPALEVLPHSPPKASAASVVPAQISSSYSRQQQTKQAQAQAQPPNDAVEKALRIARRFHQESNSIVDTSTNCSIDFAQKRQEHFQKERRKLQAFRLKNLEYVLRHEEKALRLHVECMNQMTAYEERQQIHAELQRQQQRQRQLQLEQKQQQKEQAGISNDGRGGIGSREQQRAEQTRKVQRLEHSTTSSANTKSHGTHWKVRTSLYLTNLPVNGSTTERTLQALFCSYGRVDRIIMYRHRSTGELKGDGLIVFGQDAVGGYQTKSGDETGADLVEAVCTQMNGAELPCGTMLGVQPADADYKKKSKNEEEVIPPQSTVDQVNHCSKEPRNSLPAERGLNKLTAFKAPVANTVAVSSGSDDKNTKDGNDDDLDEFFASLE